MWLNRQIKYWLILTGGCVACTQLAAQTLHLRNISVKDGLPSCEVYGVIQDRQGYMWFATDAGACRYNGRMFEVFDRDKGLCDNSVFGLHEDASGRIWFRSLSGKICYYSDGDITSIAAGRQIAQRVGYGKAMVSALSSRAGDTLVVSVSTGFVLLVPPADGYKNILEPRKGLNQQCASATARDQVLVTVSNESENRLIQIRDGNKLVNCLLPSRFQDGFFYKVRILKLRSGKYFVSSGFRHVEIDSNGNFSEIKLPYGHLESVYEDAESNIWLGFLKNGLLCYASHNWSIQPKHYLQGLSVSGICADKEGGIWFSTLENGVFYSPDHHFDQISGTDILSDNKVHTFLIDQRGHLLFSTHSGFLYDFWQPKGTDTFAYRKREFPFIAESIVEDNNGYYLGNTLVHIRDFNDPRPDTIKPNGAPAIFGKLLSMSSKGVLAIANHEQLTLRSPAGIYTSFRLPVRAVSLAYTRSGRLLIGCTNGLYVYSNGQIKLLMPDVELQTRINTVREDARGRIWIGSNEKGLFVLDGEQLTQLDNKNGLAGTKVNAVTFDAQGHAWVATYNGISKVTCLPDHIYKAENYNMSHGLLSNQVFNIICYRGAIWAATSEGISICDVRAIRKNKNPPQVVMRKLLVNDVPAGLADSNLAWNRNNLSFLFDGLSYRLPSAARFRYFLEGYDHAWHSTGFNRVDYTNLPAGHYRMVVFALNNDGVASLTPATIEFNIRKPFWLEWWFITLLVFAFLLMLGILFRWRFSVLQKREAEKTAITQKITEFRLTALRAQMNPHFIFNTISSVQHYVLNNDIDQSYDYLTRFSRLMRLVLDNSDQHEITIAQELEMLNLYVDLEKLRFEKGFVFTVDIDPRFDLRDCIIPAMLVQPYLENAIRHGLMPRKTGGELKLSLSVADSHTDLLHIVIEDNGIGRKRSMENKKENTHLSKGMLLTSDRLKSIGIQTGTHVDVEVTDLLNENGEAEGTRIRLSVTMKNVAVCTT